VGPGIVEAQPVQSQPADRPAAGKPPPIDKDLSMDDVFGGPGTPTEGPAASPGATTQAPGVAGDGGPKKPEELGMDDVFGGTTPPANPPKGMTPRESATPTISPTKGLVDPANPGADKGGPAPTSSYNGKLKTRFRLVSSLHYDVDRASPRRISRNENRLELYVAYTPNKHVQVVADAEPVLMGVSQARELDDLASQTYIQRFHMESDAAYVALTDLAPGLDIKVGRQIVVWGTADKFNPTNNINADDVEDRPLFTEPIANQMAVVDYAPLGDKLYLQGVYVPLFFPALLPPSAAYGLKDPFAEVPFANQTEKNKMNYLQETYLPANPKFTPDVHGHVVPPENAFKNGQFAFKLGSRLGEVDLSASYYYGRHDFPLPRLSQTSMTNPVNQDYPAGKEVGCCFRSDVDLIYPKMQVVGLDFATQLPFLGNMGIWGEGALIIPKQHTFTIDIPVPGGIDVTPDNGVEDRETEVSGITRQGAAVHQGDRGLRLHLRQARVRAGAVPARLHQRVRRRAHGQLPGRRQRPDLLRAQAGVPGVRPHRLPEQQPEQAAQRRGHADPRRALGGAGAGAAVRAAVGLRELRDRRLRAVRRQQDLLRSVGGGLVDRLLQGDRVVLATGF
jgi:hypothetical protein